MRAKFSGDITMVSARLLLPAFAIGAAAYQLPYAASRQASVQRAVSPSLGLFDGVKDAFTSPNEKPIVNADRVTPFDRWLGLDKDLVEEESQSVQSVTYVDPTDTSNYVTVSLAKPMGIAFVENEGECGGVYVDEVLADGSAAGASPSLMAKDQLVAVDSTVVLGASFETSIEAIKATTGETTRLVFFRGPTAFLYGPTKPSDEWYSTNLLQ